MLTRLLCGILCLSMLSGCGAMHAIWENSQDHNAFLMKYRIADMMETPGSNLNLIRGLINRFPTYYRAPACNDHGCWVAP